VEAPIWDSYGAHVIDRRMRSDAFQRTATAIRFLREQVDQQPTLEDIARHLGVAPAVAQRDFRRLVGISPKRFLQDLTAGHAGVLLDRGVDVLRASLAVGLSGSGRLHDHMVRVEAMSPGEWKYRLAGATLRWGVGATPFGAAAVARTERGIHRLEFLDGSDAEDRFSRAVRARCSAANQLHRDDREATEVLRAVFGRQQNTFGLSVVATPFQLAVWKAVLRAPPGTTVSYSELATAIGKPSAQRAVGTALGRNPIALLIPCHRVLRQDGGLNAYRWGLARKLGLLLQERNGTEKAIDDQRR